MKQLVLLILFTGMIHRANSQDQTEQNERKDSLFIYEVEHRTEPDKVLHAEPLFIDLIRDLGARKGEKEWNLGVGLTDNNKYDQYTALVEYEWAPVNRLGLEVELPFSFYYPTSDTKAPGNKLNSLKLAAQYSFYVSNRHKTSMAIGYIHEFELSEFQHYGKDQWYKGNVYNPFFVAAKRWGNNMHTLLYTGPVMLRHLVHKGTDTHWQVNTNIHYMITGTRNFIGVEVNKEIAGGNTDMVLRPQMRVGIAPNLMVGIVTGIPINKARERGSSFLRLIYEPKHKKTA